MSVRIILYRVVLGRISVFALRIDANEIVETLAGLYSMAKFATVHIYWGDYIVERECI